MNMLEYCGIVYPIMQNSILDNLNPMQHQAVTAPPGNLLVLAGAGSGKTRVLVHRIAWLMQEHQVNPRSILSVTFTNKAAGEMRARLEQLLGFSVSGMWVGTFHGLAHKMLRLHYNQCNLTSEFQIIDADDQLRIIKKLYKKYSIDDEQWEPRKAQHFINRRKDEGCRSTKLPASSSMLEQVFGEVYSYYEEYCNNASIVDFAELLLRSYELLAHNQDLLTHYRARFSHLFVDEFQDTNSIQYLWLKQLTTADTALTAVGDDDQSIYGWRGAQVENIHRFNQDFANAQQVCLDQNYRSTKTILAAANAVITNNHSRLGKTLWTEQSQGELLTIYSALNEEDEAYFLVKQLQAHVADGGCLQDVAVLYRSNAQSRVLEEALVRSGIAYSVYGGLRFFERAEIKDALGYLRLLVNCHDNDAFERVVNMPPRGIGSKTVDKIKQFALEKNISYWQAAEAAINDNIISGKAKTGLANFIDLLGSGVNDSPDLTDYINIAVHASGLLQYFKQQHGEKAQSRAANLEELEVATTSFKGDTNSEEDSSSAVVEFLTNAVLDSGTRADTDEGTKDKVQLMTMHSAKGLEFKVVFICGVEEGLFPHKLSLDKPQSLEEERRLCYVAMTRAEEKLFICHAGRRRIFGKDEPRLPSRFISEIPQELVNEIAPKITIQHSNYRSTTMFPKKAYSSPSSFSSHKENVSVPVGGGFSLGNKVSHPKFGSGIIIGNEGDGNRARLNVQFDRHGSKWLMLEYANLEHL